MYLRKWKKKQPPLTVLQQYYSPLAKTLGCGNSSSNPLRIMEGCPSQIVDNQMGRDW